MDWPNKYKPLIDDIDRYEKTHFIVSFTDTNLEYDWKLAIDKLRENEKNICMATQR